MKCRLIIQLGFNHVFCRMLLHSVTRHSSKVQYCIFKIKLRVKRQPKFSFEFNAIAILHRIDKFLHRKTSSSNRKYILLQQKSLIFASLFRVRLALLETSLRRTRLPTSAFNDPRLYTGFLKCTRS